MLHHLKSYHLAVLLLLIAFASVMGLLFVPALPELDDYFRISDATVQWTMSLFLAGYCLGQLPYGPLANRLGRKKTIYLGIGLAAIGSFFAYVAPTFWILCIARFIQAIGAAVGLKMSFTIIGDRCSGKESAKAISLLSLAFGIMPGLAVATGGFIVSSFGWRGCFLFLTFYSILIGLLSTSLPETGKGQDLEALQGKRIVKAYTTQFTNGHLVLNAFLMSCSTTIIYIFATLAPYLGIQKMGMAPSQFGLWNIFPASGLVVGAFLSRHFSNKYPSSKSVLLGIMIVLCGISAMGFSFWIGFFSAWTLFVPQFMIQSGYNLIWANSSSSAIEFSEDKSNATAVVQFINVGGTVLGTYAISFFSPTSLVLLPSAFGIIFFLMITLWFKIYRA